MPALTCSRPIVMAGRSDGATPTGEVEEKTINLPCGTRQATQCQSCAATYKGRAQIIIGAGLPDAGEAAAAVFLTLTAPSFGPVHRFGLCICGRDHTDKEVGIIGAPLNPARYDYAGAAAWHAALPALWAVTRRRIRVNLAALPGSEKVVILRVVEYQKRLAAHLHCLVIVRGVTTPPGVVAQRIMAALAVTDPAHRAETAGGFAWGAEIDAAPLYPGHKEGRNSYARAAGYLGKYLTKDAQGATVRDFAETNRTPLARHRAASERAARALVYARLYPSRWTRRPGSIEPIEVVIPDRDPARDRAITNNGYGGHFLSKSPGWGDPHPERGTFRALKAAAQAESIAKNGAQTLVWAWTYDANATRALRTLTRFVAQPSAPPA
ncbi:MAG TPA: replication initiator [Dermatophilaceae bacterium]